MCIVLEKEGHIRIVDIGAGVGQFGEWVKSQVNIKKYTVIFQIIF